MNGPPHESQRANTLAIRHVATPATQAVSGSSATLTPSIAFPLSIWDRGKVREGPGKAGRGCYSETETLTKEHSPAGLFDGASHLELKFASL